MRKMFWIAALTGFAVTGPAKAEFIGQVAFSPTGCQAVGQCKLVHDFGYVDPNKIGWQAKAGLMTDGASIPSWAQPFIGGPWEKEFIRAAVLHDYYCIRTVRDRTQTHRMFYNALLESGVGAPKASIMYYAVLVGSHMWTKPMEGKRCAGVPNCIQNVGAGIPNVPNARIFKNDAGEMVIYRAPRFEQPGILQDIEDANKIIEGNAAISPEAVEALALQRHPDDFFLVHGDTVIYEGPTSKFETQ